MTNKFIITLFLFCLLIISCVKHGIERYSMPASSQSVQLMGDGTALIRSIYSDIYLKCLDDGKIMKLVKNKIYINKNSETRAYRVPKMSFFHVVIKNTGNAPIIIDDIILKYGENILKKIGTDNVGQYTKSLMHRRLDFDKILVQKRIEGPETKINRIDYQKNTIEQDLGFILQDDRVSLVLVFEWVPVSYRKYNLIFKLNSNGNKKVIDFEISRFEYRTKGRDFLKPVPQKKNEDLL